MYRYFISPVFLLSFLGILTCKSSWSPGKPSILEIAVEIDDPQSHLEVEECDALNELQDHSMDELQEKEVIPEGKETYDMPFWQDSDFEQQEESNHPSGEDWGSDVSDLDVTVDTCDQEGVITEVDLSSVEASKEEGHQEDLSSEPEPEGINELELTYVETTPEVVSICNECKSYTKPNPIGVIANKSLKETSGLGASQIHKDIYYAHNDSGDIARFFAFDLQGNHRGEFKLEKGATNYDWEDLSVGPCGQGSCVYIGDVGDNYLQRTKYAIYIVEEPKELDYPEPVTVPFIVLPYVYPDGPQNSETIMVNPKTQDIYIVTKTSGPWVVYRLSAPHKPNVQVVAEKIGNVSLPSGVGPLSTGGDIHPCGTRVIFRSYGDLWEHVLLAGQAFEEIFKNPPNKVPFKSEPQGEAVCYDADGLGYITVSEGENATIYQTKCAE